MNTVLPEQLEYVGSKTPDAQGLEGLASRL
jgi:hypothetical protein